MHFLRNWDLTDVGSNPTRRPRAACSSVVEHQNNSAFDSLDLFCVDVAETQRSSL